MLAIKVSKIHIVFPKSLGYMSMCCRVKKNRLFTCCRLQFVQRTEMVPQLIHRPETMRDRVLGRLVHFAVRLLEAVRLKTRIPAKVAASAWRHDVALRLALEQFHIRIGTVRVGKRAHSLGALVIPAVQHPQQTLGFEALQEPFDVGAYGTGMMILEWAAFQ